MINATSSAGASDSRARSPKYHPMVLAQRTALRVLELTEVYDPKLWLGCGLIDLEFCILSFGFQVLGSFLCAKGQEAWRFLFVGFWAVGFWVLDFGFWALLFGFAKLPRTTTWAPEPQSSFSLIL